MTFALQYVSDLHTEMEGCVPDIQPCADYLALCGDIGNIFDEENLYEVLIHQVAGKFKHVFVVLGNHEYYGSVMDDVDSKTLVLKTKYPNVHFLNKSSFIIPGIGVRILGCTLWSDVSDSVKYHMNDYRRIYARNIKDGKKRRLIPHDVRLLHKDHVFWLDREISCDNETPTIILTHHAADQRMNGIYQGSELSSAFATDLPGLFRPPVKAWICGHTHQNVIVYVRGIPHITNCKGYSGECPDYDPCKVLHVNLLPTICNGSRNTNTS